VTFKKEYTKKNIHEHVFKLITIWHAQLESALQITDDLALCDLGPLEELIPIPLVNALPIC
jgi:hypothetical protein